MSSSGLTESVLRKGSSLSRTGVTGSEWSDVLVGDRLREVEGANNRDGHSVLDLSKDPRSDHRQDVFARISSRDSLLLTG